jgi:hypothetical protein
VRGETQVYFKESHRIRWEVIDDNREKRGNTSKFERQREEEEDDDENEEGEYQDGHNKGGLNSKEGTSASFNIQEGREGVNSHKHKGQQIGQDEKQLPTKDVMMEKEGVMEKLQNNVVELKSNQDKLTNVTDILAGEEGRKTGGEEEPIQTQQSSTAACEGEGKGKGEGEDMCEEELVDYDEDPAIAEKLEMAELEKKVENRAKKLMDSAAIIVPAEVPMSEGVKLKK